MLHLIIEELSNWKQAAPNRSENHNKGQLLESVVCLGIDRACMLSLSPITQGSMRSGMQEAFHQYNLITELASKYSHSTYLAYPANEPEHQVVLTLFTASLFDNPYERESLLQYELITGRVPFASQGLTSMIGHRGNPSPALTLIHK